MKKIKIDYQIRYGVIIGLLFISILTIGLGILKQKQETKPIQKEEVLYEYTITPHILYKVKNQPNLLSREDYIKQGSSYLSKFVESIESTLSYHFTGSQEIQMKGRYEVTAQARGYSIKDNEKQIIWEKNYKVVPLKKFEYIGDRLFLKEEVTIDFQRHNQFAKQVIEEAGANMPAEFVVTMKGEVELQTETGVIVEPINQSIVIPLGGSYFEVIEVGNEKRTEKVVNQVVETGEAEGKMNKVLLGVVIATWIGLVVIIMGTEGKQQVTSLAKQSNKIFREYRGYLVGIECLEQECFLQQYKVKEIKDLIKVADELEKPILYIGGEKSVSSFFVVDEKILYGYELNV